MASGIGPRLRAIVAQRPRPLSDHRATLGAMMTYEEINAVVSQLKAGDHVWLRTTHESGNYEDATGVIWESDNGYLCLGPRVIRWPEGMHPESFTEFKVLTPA